MQVNLIYGPPGTGKTTKLLSVLEEELKSVDPDKIAFVSFTRKGSYEGKNRAMEKFGFKSSDLPFFRTLHSLAFKDANLTRGEIISKFHYRQFSEATGMKFTGYYTEELKNDDDKYLFFDSLYRNNRDAADGLMGELNPRLLAWLTKEFTRFKHTLGIYDFTDIMEMFVNQGSPFNVEVAIIDEAQDLTSLQWQFVWKAFRKCRRMYIAGDDDQAIYEWSGADVKYFLNLKGDFQVLNTSWRLPSAIHTYALKVVSGINNRIEKEFAPNKKGGQVTLLNSFKEVVIDNQNTWMFLSRNSWHLKAVEKWLQDKGIVYYNKDTLSFEPNFLRAIRAHNKVMHKKPITEAERLLCASYMGQDASSWFKKPWYEEFTQIKQEKIDYYRNIIGNKTDLNNVYVKVSTIHGVKGGQADNVVLLLGYNKTIEVNFNKNPDSEMRCYYVAVTRAKQKLFLVLPETKFGYNYLGGYI